MHATLTFLKDLPIYDVEKPFKFVGFPHLPKKWQTNCLFTNEHNIPVTDVRTLEEKGKEPLSIDTCGFQYVEHKSACLLQVEDLESNDVEKQENITAYLEESIELVKTMMGEAGGEVFCFDWRLRKNENAPAFVPAEDVENIRHYALPPAKNIHLDFSQRGGFDRLALHLSDKDLAEVHAGLWHVRFFNVWRPLRTVENSPLVLCDRRSVRPSDLVEVDKVLPEKIEYTSYLKHREYHDWYWLSGQRNDEVVVFLTWDSMGEELCDRTRCADVPPHGACLDPGKPGSLPRESVEVRLFVMTPIK